MKRRLLNTTVIFATLACFNVATAQQCCIYERVGGSATYVTCTQPANSLLCAQSAYNWSPSEGAVDPTADDRLQSNGLGLFSSSPVNCTNSPGPFCAEFIALPVEFTSFEATYTGGGEVELKWETASETNNAGFYVERQIGSTEFSEIAFVEGSGTTTNSRAYSFNVTGLDAGHHVFRLRQVDFDGAFEYSDVVEATVELPNTFVLEPAYPNPFNPSTSIRFGTTVETEVTVDLYDSSGKLVRTLFEGIPEPGALNTITIDGSGLTSGTYLVKLSSSDFQTSQPIVLLK